MTGLIETPCARRRGRWGLWAARTLGWAALSVVTGLLVRAEVTRPDGMDGVVTYSGIVYQRQDGRRLELDLHLPDGTPPQPSGWPAVVAIHGGGWRGGSRIDFGRMVARLARHGVAVAAIDYTLSRPGEPSWPRNLDDVRAAVRWVRRHAGDFHLDAGRIAALGASAGGHLAALVGTVPGDPESRVQAVVDLYGPADLMALGGPCRLRGGPVDLLLGGLPDACPDRARAASPVAHVAADTPPMLLIHGGDDQLIPADQSRRLAAALDRHGVRNRLIVLEDASHGFGLVVGDRDLVPEMLAFLDGAWNDSDSTYRNARLDGFSGLR